MARPRTLDPVKMAQDINKYVEDHDLPFVASICTDLDINNDSLHRLAKECEELSDALKKASRKCESMILQRGLTGRYNGSVSIFLLKNYGWTDKQPEETDSKIEVSLGSSEEYAE